MRLCLRRSVKKVLEKVNWLTITTPFIAGYTALNWGRENGEGIIIPALVGLLAFLGLIAVWYVLYQFAEFPFWMARFN